MKDEFLATLSHELRTPLNAILGWAHLLTTGKADPATAQRALGVIRNNAMAQSQLIEDILDVSRIISGKLRLNLAPVSLRDVMDAALDSVSPAAEAKNITIDREIDDIDPIPGDRDRLQQVFWNLLSNAVKFTPRDGRVTVRLKRERDNAAISVEDTGIGISTEFLPYVFDRFSQADGSATRRHGGLGLGLAIVRYLVELHGGTMRADSEGENCGARFTALLPMRVLQPMDDAGEPIERASLEDVAGADDLPHLSGLCILVVDDEQDSRAFLGTLLQSQGASVCSAASTPEALETFVRERPDVVISDIAMPCEDGYDLIRQLRALPRRDGGLTPAVALTAYVRDEDVAAALAAGYQRHIKKPVVVSELIGAVAELAAAPSRAE